MTRKSAIQELASPLAIPLQIPQIKNTLVQTGIKPLLEKIKELVPGVEELAIFTKVKDPVLAAKIGGQWYELYRWE